MEQFIREIQKSTNPQPGDVYVNQLLPNIAVSYFQTQGGLHTTFPAAPVELQTGVFAAFSRADSMRFKTELRAPGTDVAQIGLAVDTSGTYSCKVYAAEFAPPAEVVANYRLPIQIQMLGTRLLARAAYLRRELSWISSFFTTGVWTTDVTPTVTWDDPSSSPISDIETGIETVLLATGMRPNVLSLGYQVWKALKQHPDIIARIGTGSASNFDPRMVTTQLVAALFGLEEIKVGEVVYNTAAAGASASMSFAAGKNALLTYRTPNPDIMTPSAGYRFAWQGLTGSVEGVQVLAGVDERRGETWTQIRHADDFKKVAAELGYFFSNAVA